MTPDPVILILEDERLQILTLRAQLSELGRLQEFTDPEEALEYARQNPCDAAVIDVRMPRRSMDGLGFLRALRTFDEDLAVVIRTADESERIADGAIELRAVKRAIKSKTSAAELRRVTGQAVLETRQRRETVAAARKAAAIQSRLVEASGDYDLRLAAAALQRGLVHGLRKKLTSLSVLTSLMRVGAAEAARPTLVDQADRAAGVVKGMIDSVNAYLDGPFGPESEDESAAVNECLGALGQIYCAGDRPNEGNKRIAIRPLRNDAYAACRPLDLANGIRHLMEFFLANLAPDGEATLVADLVVSPVALVDRVNRSAVIWNRPAIRGGGTWISFRISGALPGCTLPQIKDALSQDVGEGRSGNLRVLAKVAERAQGTILLLGNHPVATMDVLIAALE